MIAPRYFHEMLLPISARIFDFRDKQNFFLADNMIYLRQKYLQKRKTGKDFMRKSKTTAACIWGFCVILCMTMLMPIPAQAAEDTLTFTISPEYGQTEARSMLSMINEFRTGSDAWWWNEDNTEKKYAEEGFEELTYDYNLEKIAMQRAAEIAVYFSHTRPNGENYSTAYTGTYKLKAENITAGHTTAEDAFEGWQESDKDFSEQGHRRNMLNSAYTAVGIAHVTYEGVDFWVQEFGNPNSGASETAAVDGEQETTIELKKEYIVEKVTLPDDITVEEGDAAALSDAEYSLATTGIFPEKAAIKKQSQAVTCVIADTTIASFSDGKITGLSAGTTTATVSAFGEEKTITITVTEKETEKAHTYQLKATQWLGSTIRATFKCSTCGEIITVDQPIEETITTEPTCTEKGEKNLTAVITLEDKKYDLGKKVTVLALGHTGGTATCTKQAVCIRCGEEYGTVDTSNHTGAKEVKNVSEPTCTEKGYTGDTYCTDCGGKVASGEEIAAKGHEEVIDAGKETTCTETGLTEGSHCSICGEILKAQNKIEALGHTGGTATCISKAVCEKCGEEYGETDAAYHAGEREIRDAKEASCIETGYTGDTYCRDCGKKIGSGNESAAKGHVFGSWTTTIKATEDAEGVQERKCSVCGYTETKQIPKKEKTDSGTTESSSTESTQTETGKSESSNTESTQTESSKTDPADQNSSNKKNTAGNQENTSGSQTSSVKKGAVYTAGSASYKVTNAATNGTVTYTGTKNKKRVTSLTVPNTVKINGKTFRVTAVSAKAFSGAKKLTKVTIGNNVTVIEAQAFANCKKLKSVTIGSNVTTIGAKAFYGDKALKKITIKSKKLKKVGKKAVKGIHKKAVIKVPSSKLKAYKKLFKSKTGFKKTMKLKK